MARSGEDISCISHLCQSGDDNDESGDDSDESGDDISLEKSV